MTTCRRDVADGWMRFWDTFGCSLPTVLGFGGALVVYGVLGDLLEMLWRMLW